VFDACRLGSTPVAAVPLDPGKYGLLFRRAGFEDQVLLMDVPAGLTQVCMTKLLSEGSTPEGFVRAQIAFDPTRWVWIQERETTCAEYVEFLNDPYVQAEIAASPAPIRFPRGPGDRSRDGIWARASDGRFEIPAAEFGADFPVLGVSFGDAKAYAAWRARRDGRAYALPTRDEWVYAGVGFSDRRYPFGDTFSPRWVKSCFSRPQAYPEAVMSYPVDESAFGVYDACGSAAEWLDAWFDESRGLRRLGGQSWGRSDPVLFGLWGGYGQDPDLASHETGFRLVILPEAPR
jgi:formylglycine-generating enzyme required for sulfatase activity